LVAIRGGVDDQGAGVPADVEKQIVVGRGSGLRDGAGMRVIGVLVGVRGVLVGVSGGGMADRVVHQISSNRG